MLISLPPITIAIVGAGFSGSLVAVHLLKAAPFPLVIQLIDRSYPMGRGIAYHTRTASHLLNVPAGKMSAFADDPDHFLRWLNLHQGELATLLPDDLNAHCFIPRQIYGLYLQSILEEAEAAAPDQVRLERIFDEVVAVEPQPEGAILKFRSRQISADKVVLALGNTAADQPFTGSYIRDAWSPAALADLEPDSPVLLVGTGLTMVDLVMSLHERQHRGQIYAVSRRGLLPQAHLPINPLAKPYPNLPPEIAPRTIRGLLRWIRHEVNRADRAGYNWRAVVDSLRPLTQQLWQHLSDAERRRFLRHLSPYWDVHRHRIAPEIAQILQTMLNSGQLKRLAGRIQGYQLTPDGVAVDIRQRQTQTRLMLPVSRVVNCTGIHLDYRQATQPLIAHLRDQGLIRPNPLGLGLETAADGTVLESQGHCSTFLYTLGAPRKGNLWETTAVPELREQAQALATTILQSLPADSIQITEIDREIIKQMLSSNLETDDNYFAMYI